MNAGDPPTPPRLDLARRELESCRPATASLLREMAADLPVVRPRQRSACSSRREILLGLSDARYGEAVVQVLRAARVDAVVDAGQRGRPATVHVVIPTSASIAGKSVLEFARFVDPSVVRLTRKASPRQSVRQLAPRVASQGWLLDR